jgi:hypothetical protein
MRALFKKFCLKLAGLSIPKSKPLIFIIQFFSRPDDLRQMEKARRGFKTRPGQIDHPKLFQITHYLKEII